MTILSTKLHCIIDSSGSMAEYGKPMLLVNLLRYIRQFTSETDKSANYFCWREDIVEINWLAGTDIELPALKGSNHLDSLCDWIEANPEAMILVLTDGYFNLDASQRRQLSQLDNLYLVAVGGDADFEQLRRVSDYSFRAEQLDRALQTIYRPKVVTLAPLNQVELLKLNDNNGMEDDDEW